MSYDDFRDNIKIKKDVSIVIDGEAVRILSDICEIVNRRLSNNKTVDEYDDIETHNMRKFIGHIFDCT